MIILPLKLKPAKVLKENSIKSKAKPISRKTYCLAFKKDGDDKFYAKVNTKGMGKYTHPTVFEFSDESYDLVGKTIVFSKKEDKNGLVTKYIRTTFDSITRPGNRVDYCPICRNAIFSGKLVKDKDGIVKFDIDEYIRQYHGYDELLDF